MEKRKGFANLLKQRVILCRRGCWNQWPGHLGKGEYESRIKGREEVDRVQYIHVITNVSRQGCRGPHHRYQRPHYRYQRPHHRYQPPPHVKSICPVKGARWLARGMDYHGVSPKHKDTLAYAKRNAALEMAREQT